MKMMRITQSIVIVLLSVCLLTHCSSKKNKDQESPLAPFSAGPSDQNLLGTDTKNPLGANTASTEQNPPGTEIHSPEPTSPAKLQVVCSHQGNHSDLISYEISHDQEIATLTHLIEMTLNELDHVTHPTVPDFAKALSELAPRLVYVINHDPNMNALGSIWGYSAEDDPDYQYPDQNLYPKGSIKVNFTHSFMKDLIGYKTLEPQSQHDAYEIIFKSVVVHEITHAWQYYTHPVPDFLRVPEALDNGILIDEDILAGHKAKINYEHDAYWVDHAYLKNLLKKANYDVSDIKVDGEFNESQNRLYYGQYIPVEIVYTLNLAHKNNHELEEEDIEKLIQAWDWYVTHSPIFEKMASKNGLGYTYLNDTKIQYDRLIPYFTQDNSSLGLYNKVYPEIKLDSKQNSFSVHSLDQRKQFFKVLLNQDYTHMQ